MNSVRAGQVWTDADLRRAPRRLLIVDVTGHDVTVLVDGARARIRVERFTVRPTAYRLVKDAPDRGGYDAGFADGWASALAKHMIVDED